MEINRIARTYKRQPKLANRILTEEEYALFQSLNGRQIEFLAGRFAAKEAYAKAIGTGIGSHLNWKDIQVLSNDAGKPILQANIPWAALVSISHSKQYAVAQVILETSS